jgi:hypothetical protein
MIKLTQILSIAILIMCVFQVFATWGTTANAGWLVALIGWIEVTFYQRKERIVS